MTQPHLPLPIKTGHESVRNSERDTGRCEERETWGMHLASPFMHFDLPNPSSQLHVTMVKVNYKSQPGEGTIWFDYFYVTDPTITSMVPLTPSSTLSPITNAVHQSTPVGMIVSSVLGALLLMLVLSLVLVFYHQHHATKLVSQQPDDCQSTILVLQSRYWHCTFKWCPIVLMAATHLSAHFCSALGAHPKIHLLQEP